MSEERDVSLEGDVADTDIMPSAPPVDDEEDFKSPSTDGKQVSSAKGLSLDKEHDAEADKKPAPEPVMGAVDKPPNKFFLITLASLLVITGSLNTIAAKWANTTCIKSCLAPNCSDPEGYKEVVEDYLITANCSSNDPSMLNARFFDHPFFQADVMFVGEVCCMLAYLVSLMIQRYQWRRRKANHVCTAGSGSVSGTLMGSVLDSEKRDSAVSGSEWSTCDSVTTCQSCYADVNTCEVCNSECPTVPRFNWFLFAIPAFCDVVATSIQYVGLVLTSAASYQMLRGAVIIFTGILSIFFLHMRLELYRWAGMITVVIGLVIVGVTDILLTKETATTSTLNIIIGDVLVIVAQIVVALQMVAEQKFLAGCDVPALFAVGLEGIFGFLILSICIIPMYFIHVTETFSNSPGLRLEDALDAFQEMHDSGELVGALCLTVASIAFFNFSGVSVTKYMSATTRMVLDSIRTIIIWAVSIPLFHSQFIPYQIIGFVFLVGGMFIYNDILLMPFVRKTNLYKRMFPKWAAELEASESEKE